MRILGIPLCHETVSNEQYIERIRKRLQQTHRWRYFQGIIAVFILGMTIWLVFMAIGFLGDFTNLGKLTGNEHPTMNQELAYATFAIAAIFGFLSGHFFYKALSFIAETFFGQREERLLVECWDALSDAEKSRLRQNSS